MTRRTTVADLRANKGVRKILTMHVDNEMEAAAAREAGIEMFTCEVDEMLPLIRANAGGTFVQAAHSQGVIASAESAIREGFRALEKGADAVYYDGDLRFVEAMANVGIPVSGHIGLVPRWATWTNMRAVGKTVDEAVALYCRLKDYENAGAWAVEMEVVPVEIADFLTRCTPLITQGMGCGAVCDTQYLFSSDVLGTHTGHTPRHAKIYADLIAEEARVQQVRVRAFEAFSQDVKTGRYPEAGHEIRAAAETLEALEKFAQQSR